MFGVKGGLGIGGGVLGLLVWGFGYVCGVDIGESDRGVDGMIV